MNRTETSPEIKGNFTKRTKETHQDGSNSYPYSTNKVSFNAEKTKPSQTCHSPFSNSYRLRPHVKVNINSINGKSSLYQQKRTQSAPAPIKSKKSQTTQIPKVGVTSTLNKENTVMFPQCPALKNNVQRNLPMPTLNKINGSEWLDFRKALERQCRETSPDRVSSQHLSTGGFKSYPKRYLEVMEYVKSLRNKRRPTLSMDGLTDPWLRIHGTGARCSTPSLAWVSTKSHPFDTYSDPEKNKKNTTPTHSVTSSISEDEGICNDDSIREPTRKSETGVDEEMVCYGPHYNQRAGQLLDYYLKKETVEKFREDLSRGRHASCYKSKRPFRHTASASPVTKIPNRTLPDKPNHTSSAGKTKRSGTAIVQNQTSQYTTPVLDRETVGNSSEPALLVEEKRHGFPRTYVRIHRPIQLSPRMGAPVTSCARSDSVSTQWSNDGGNLNIHQNGFERIPFNSHRQIKQEFMVVGRAVDPRRNIGRSSIINR